MLRHFTQNRSIMIILVLRHLNLTLERIISICHAALNTTCYKYYRSDFIINDISINASQFHRKMKNRRIQLVNAAYKRATLYKNNCSKINSRRAFAIDFFGNDKPCYLLALFLTLKTTENLCYFDSIINYVRLNLMGRYQSTPTML